MSRRGTLGRIELANTSPNSVINSASKALAALSMKSAIFVCALIYTVVTGFGLMTEGYNFDDWRHLDGTPELWAGPEGRWVMDFLFRFIMMERFHLPLQILLAFPCLLACSYGLARYAMGRNFVALAMVFIFLIGTHHVYMSSALMFNAHIFAYPLAFFLSFLAFHLVFKARQRSGVLVQIGVLLLSGQLLALSLGIYQTYALFGLAIPVLIVLLYDRYALRREWVFLLHCLLVCLIGLLLYRLEWHLYLAALDTPVDLVRFEPPTIADLFSKVGQLPDFLARIYAGALVPSSTVFRLVNALAAMTVFGAVSLAIYAALRDTEEPSPRARLFAVARIIAATFTLLVILPVLFWFTYKDTFTPARVVAFVEFWLPALILAALALAVRRRKNRVTQGAFVGGALALSVISAVTVLTASETWSDRARIFEMDKDHARAVYARVNAMDGHDGQTFRVIGGVDYTNFSRGGQLGWTTLHASNPRLGIFKSMYNLDAFIASYPISPQACDAMPSASASYVHEGVAYVCLEAKPSFLPLTECVDIDRDGGGSICLKHDMIIHKVPDCTSADTARRALHIDFRDAAGTVIGTAKMHPEIVKLPLSDGCYKAVDAPDQAYHSLEISLTEAGTGSVWTQSIARDAFPPASPDID